MTRCSEGTKNSCFHCSKKIGHGAEEALKKKTGCLKLDLKKKTNYIFGVQKKSYTAIAMEKKKKSLRCDIEKKNRRKLPLLKKKVASVEIPFHST